jgi:DNA-binding transcriptional regulator YhcF (GntR family)
MAGGKREAIIETLRQRIRTGQYRPGERIPPQRELLKEFQVSPVTLQRAIDRLSELGYFESHGRAGTFLVTHPPDRSRCALVFSEPANEAQNRFYATLERVAQTWSDGSPWHFEICHAHPGSAAHDDLCERVQAGALAGLVFSSLPYPYLGSPLLHAAIPRVAIGERPNAHDAQQFATSRINLATDGLLERLCGDLASVGRRRVAVFCAPLSHAHLHSGMAITRHAGLETRPEWWLGLPIAADAAGVPRRIAHLLCSGREEDRPDCVLIRDDNLAPAVVAGIRDSGLSIPEDLTLLAHANFPLDTSLGVPCRRFGYDTRQLLSLAVAEIARLATGAAPCDLELPVTFDHATSAELSDDSSAEA